MLSTGPEVFGIRYCNWDVAVAVCRKAMATSWSLVPVLAGRTTCLLNLDIGEWVTQLFFFELKI